MISFFNLKSHKLKIIDPIFNLIAFKLKIPGVIFNLKIC